MKSLTLSVELLFALQWIAGTKGEPDWIFDVLDVNCTNKTPELFEANLYLKRIARGRFVIAGNITSGVDLTDDTEVYAELFYSPTAQHFVRSPLQISRTPLSDFLNSFYKDIYLEGFNACATNPPLSDASETFVPPLTKRVMVLEDCTFPNDQMPSFMRPGYYRFILALTKQVETTITTLIKVEPK